tara:strand:- start:8282 stop:9799 length:1518 start_codon:yes stop_codon:yes gene_type:complete
MALNKYRTPSLGIIFPIIFLLLSLPTIFGYDSDFAFYATSANMLANGMDMYDQVYDHKPPLYHHTLIIGVYLNNLFNSKLLGFFIVHFLILALFYFASLMLLKQTIISIGVQWSKHFDIFLFSFFTISLLAVPGLVYGNLNGGIVYLATTFELLAITKVIRLLNTNTFSKVGSKDFLILAIFTSAALLTRIHFAAFLAICFFILLYSNDWMSMLKNLSKFIIFTCFLFLVGIFILIGDFSDFYSAIFGDNLVYTDEKTDKYLAVLYFAVKHNFYTILLVIASVLVSILRLQSFRETLNILVNLISKKSVVLLLIFATLALFVIALTLPGPVLYRYYGLMPVVAIGSIILIIAFSSKKSLIFFSSSALAATFFLYSISLRNVEFKLWESNKLVAILKTHAEKNEEFFTADFNSWLYLMTDTVPSIKSQSLMHLAYPTTSKKIDAFETALSSNPKFITFSSLPNGNASEVEDFVIQNSEVFRKEYKFVRNFDTPYHSPITTRLWERK